MAIIPPEASQMELLTCPQSFELPRRALPGKAKRGSQAYLAGPHIPGFDFGAEASTHKKAVVFRMKFQGSDSEVTLTTEYLCSYNTKRGKRKYSDHKINIFNKTKMPPGPEAASGDFLETQQGGSNPRLTLCRPHLGS